jgi:carboxymethylenebutenolidase
LSVADLQEKVAEASRKRGALLSEQTELQASLQEAQTELRQQEVAIATREGEFNSQFSRREFCALSVAAGMSLLLPSVVAAVAVIEEELNIKTPYVLADAYFVYPETGTGAGVVVWPDILGLLPAYRTMGKRLAEQGYSVLVVNPFYRSRKAPIVPDGTKFSEGMPVARPMAGLLNPTTHVSDAKALVAWLDTQPSVSKTRKIGTTGYCMGGPIVMRTAAALPERIGAAATFHGGTMASAAANSPHLLVPQMKAQTLHCIAQNDDTQNPNNKVLLREAYDNARLAAEIEVYAAPHGWCALDSDSYNMEQAEKAHARLLALFEKALA